MTVRELHPQVARYVTLMRSRWSWFGAEDPTNKTGLRRLSIIYSRVRWVFNIVMTILLGVSLNDVDGFGLYNGAFAYFPFSFIMSVLITIKTFTGTQQDQLTNRFSIMFINHTEPWMNEIRERYLGVLMKFLRVFSIYVDAVIISYQTVPFIGNIVMHYGFGAQQASFILPGHLTAYLGDVVNFDSKYYLVSVLNMWAMMDQMCVMHSTVFNYSSMITFFLVELEKFGNQLNSLNYIDYSVQEQVDNHYRLVVASHDDLVRLNDELKRYLGLEGAIVSMFVTINITLLSFTLTTTSNVVLIVEYGSGVIMLLSWVMLICYLGQRMENKGEDIFRSVYNLRWYELSPEIRKSINMILRQARTPMTIDYHGRFQMNFNNFKQILRSSYSFFTLLQSTTTG